MDAQHPHGGQPVLRRGPPPRTARFVMILAHGRGSSGDDMLGLAREFSAEDVSYLAPHAAGHTWYPYPFLAPIARNEPYLSSALRLLGELVEQVGSDGVSPDRIVLLGFSQGACLSLEFAARRDQSSRRSIVGFASTQLLGKLLQRLPEGSKRWRQATAGSAAAA